MTSSYHPGELAVRLRAGVPNPAVKVPGFTIPPVAAEMLRAQPLAVAGVRDAEGRMWAFALTGKPGFIQVLDESTVIIQSKLPDDTMESGLKTNSHLGLVVVDFGLRRRMRLNGSAKVQADGTLLIQAQEVYSNCPQYIQERHWKMAPASEQALYSQQTNNQLSAKQVGWIESADTFFIASSGPEGRADASHRGGNPGFVRVLDERLLVWPDYAGNKLFQTLGNIYLNPNVGLLFLDFNQGDLLQLTGTAKTIWESERLKEFPGAERLVEFEIAQIRETKNAHPLRWEFISYSSRNPPLNSQFTQPKDTS